MIGDDIGSIGSLLGNSITTRVSRVSGSIYWFMTWNNYLDDDVAPFIELLDSKCKMYCIGKEVGASGTRHLQGKIALNTKGRPLELFPKGIHWEKSKVWKGAEYCAKDQFSGDEGVSLFTKGFTMLKCNKPTGWQITALELLNTQSDREVLWIWEDKGKMGKSSLSRFLAIKKQGLILAGKGSDMKYVVSTQVNKGLEVPIVILDIPRSNLRYVSYTGIEEIKNGAFCSTKFESGQCLMNPPKMICLANTPPDFHKLSADRWLVYEIVDSDTLIKSKIVKNVIDELF